MCNCCFGRGPTGFRSHTRLTLPAASPNYPPRPLLLTQALAIEVPSTTTAASSTPTAISNIGERNREREKWGSRVGRKHVRLMFSQPDLSLFLFFLPLSESPFNHSSQPDVPSFSAATAAAPLNDDERIFDRDF